MDWRGLGMPPASSNKTWYVSDSRFANTAPAEPPPTAIKRLNYQINVTVLKFIFILTNNKVECVSSVSVGMQPILSLEEPTVVVDERVQSSQSS